MEALVEDKDVSGEVHPPEVYLRQIARDMRTLKQMMAKVINYMVDAEAEVSEKMRRFIMYYHDIHDVCYTYTEMGHEPPQHIKRELERCDDRFRQLLEVAHSDGGVFEKVRREMAADPLNRWDHTRQLTRRPNNETRQSVEQRPGGESGAPSVRDQPELPFPAGNGN
jgi:hypothetical protein